MDFENDYIEPESAYTLKDGKAEVKIQFSMEAMERAATAILQQHIELNFVPKLERATQNFLELKGYANFDSLIKEVIKEEFIKRYPDVVENKVNEVADFVKKLRPEDAKDWRWDATGKNIGELAKKKVQEYIENELKKEIKVTTDYLEQFSRNYFANNLFKAMGMMDKMIPQIKETK